MTRVTAPVGWLHNPALCTVMAAIEAFDADPILIEPRVVLREQRLPVSALAWAVALGINGAALFSVGDIRWLAKREQPPIAVELVIEHTPAEVLPRDFQNLQAVHPLQFPAPRPPVTAAPPIWEHSPPAASLPVSPLELAPVSTDAHVAPLLVPETAPVSPIPFVPRSLTGADLEVEVVELVPLATSQLEAALAVPTPLTPAPAVAATPLAQVKGSEQEAQVGPPAVTITESRPATPKPRRSPAPETLQPSGGVDEILVTPAEAAETAVLASAPSATVVQPIEAGVPSVRPANVPSEADVAALLAHPPVEAGEAPAQRALQQPLLSIPCGRVEASLDRGAAIMQLVGHVRSPADRARLIEQVSGLAGLQQVDDRNLYVVGEPYCQVLSLLAHPSLAQSADQRFGPGAIGEPAQAGVLRFRAGMPLALQLVTPTFASSIYIDYYTSDGQVFHLLPVAGSAEHRFTPNLRVGIGGPDGRGLKAIIGPPFGLDMVVALALEKPLQMPLRPAIEDARSYLQALGSAIEALRREDELVQIEFSYYLVLTAAE